MMFKLGNDKYVEYTLSYRHGQKHFTNSSDIYYSGNIGTFITSKDKFQPSTSRLTQITGELLRKILILVTKTAPYIFNVPIKQ